MDGPFVTYCGTASDGRHVRVLLHGHVAEITVEEAEELRRHLNCVIDEAHRRAPRRLPRAAATVTHLFGRRR